MRRMLTVAATVLAALALSAGSMPVQAAPALRPQIIGGGPSDITAHPWQVVVYANNSLCSGALITSTWAVTAAHCLDGGVPPDRVEILAGISRLSQRSPAVRLPVAEVIVGPGPLQRRCAAGVVQFLRAHGLDVSVRLSEIPLAR